MVIIFIPIAICFIRDTLKWRKPRILKHDCNSPLCQCCLNLLSMEKERLYAAPFKWSFLVLLAIGAVWFWFSPISNLNQFINRECYLVGIYGIFLVRIVNISFFHEKIKLARRAIARIHQAAEDSNPTVIFDAKTPSGSRSFEPKPD